MFALPEIGQINSTTILRENKLKFALKNALLKAGHPVRVVRKNCKL